MDPPRPPCQKGNHCLDIRRGECSFWHQACFHGPCCTNIKRMDCAFYHPKIQYPNFHQISPGTNHNIKYTPHVVHRPGTKPKNANKRWSPQQDQKLWRWMQDTPSQYHKSTRSLQYLARKHQRTAIAVQVRMDKLTNTHDEERQKAQNQRKIHKNSSNKHHHSDSNHTNTYNIKHEPYELRRVSNAKGTMNLNQIENVSNVFEALKRYYKKDNNLYEIRNINTLQTRLNHANWKGDRKDLENIAGVNWEHFEAQLKMLKGKYGIITDERMKHKTLRVLNGLKQKYKREIRDMDRILNDIEKRKWCGDMGEFKEIAGKDLVYFERKLCDIRTNSDMDTNRNNLSNGIGVDRRRSREQLCDEHRPLKRRKLKGNVKARTSRNIV